VQPGYDAESTEKRSGSETDTDQPEFVEYDVFPFFAAVLFTVCRSSAQDGNRHRLMIYSGSIPRGSSKNGNTEFIAVNPKTSAFRNNDSPRRSRPNP